MLEKALHDITTLCHNDPVPTDVLNHSSHHEGYTATDSACGSVPKNSPNNDSNLQRPLSPMGKLHFTPVDSGYQSLLASPLSETKPHLVASSPIPADQISLQGQLSNDLQPDQPAGTIKGCLHNVTQPCKSCQSAATAPSQQHDIILDTSVFHSSTLILV